MAQHQEDLNTRMRVSTGAEGSALKTMLIFTIMMVTLPIFSYFASKYVMEQIFAMESAYLYAAGISVIAVHIVLVMFVVAAWREDTKTVKQEQFIYPISYTNMRLYSIQDCLNNCLFILIKFSIFLTNINYSWIFYLRIFQFCPAIKLFGCLNTAVLFLSFY